jgi:DNA-binding SARP family transcriptional activator
LRNALANLRHVIRDQKTEPPYLIIDRETVQFNLSSDHWLDVREFEALSAPGKQPILTDFPQSQITDLKSAVSLYRGSFLQGFSLKDSSAFEEWSLLVREDLHRKVVSGLTRLAQESELREEFDLSCAYAYRLVALEPWNEEYCRQLMRLLTLNGQCSAALAYYETFRRSLVEELDILPNAETVQLYERIRAGELKGTPRPQFPPHNLPAPLSPIVGREVELSELSVHLEDPACRLLTVIGPGGCGKTRLAIEAAYRQVGSFKHGVYFVAMAAFIHHNSFHRQLHRHWVFYLGQRGIPGSRY